MKLKLLELLIPLFLGPLTFGVMQLAKRASEALDRQSPLLKRTVVVALAWVVTWAATQLGVDVNCAVEAPEACIAALDHGAVKALLAALVAFVLHGLKPKPTRDVAAGIEA